MQKTLSTLALGVALAVAAPASVQSSAPVGLAVRVGVFIPTDANTRNGSNGWFAGGIDYKLGMVMKNSDNPWDLMLSLDYASHNNFRAVPVVVSIEQHRGPVFYSLGLGVSFTRRDLGNDAAGNDVVEDKSQFAYQLGLGYDFGGGSTPLFIEGKFMGNGVSDMNGFGIFLGARF